MRCAVALRMAHATWDPQWWTDEHSSSWARVKHAVRRDWEQTKGDLADSGVDLNQGAADTIRQAVGRQAIPPHGLPNPGPRHRGIAEWDSLEAAVRYGYGARLHYRDSAWDDGVRSRLRGEWETGARGTWEEAEAGVASGWHSARRAL